MARKVIETILDDIDGSENAETISFSLDGVAYEIDLAERNATKLYDVLKPYREAGRKINTSRASSGSSTRRKAPTHDLEAVRAWASKNGHKVAERGRIAQSVLDAYDAAN